VANLAWVGNGIGAADLKLDPEAAGAVGALQEHVGLRA
jgi:hypothetical protein